MIARLLPVLGSTQTSEQTKHSQMLLCLSLYVYTAL